MIEETTCQSYLILTTSFLSKGNGFIIWTTIIIIIIEKKIISLLDEKMWLFPLFLPSWVLPYFCSPFLYLFSLFLNDRFERKNGNDSLQPICCLNNCKEKTVEKVLISASKFLARLIHSTNNNWTHLSLSLSLKLESQSDWHSHFTRKRM